jgi:hypothetical protein
MNQAQLELDSPATSPADRTGFDIGWDHARHGLVPPAELLHPGTAVCQGWTAAKAVFGRRTLASSRHTRRWLQLRLLAWRSGIDFQADRVTPNYLSQIEVARCPVRRCPLGGAPGTPDAAGFMRLNPRVGFVAGNLVMVSQQAASAMENVDAAQAQRLAHAAAGPAGAPHLDSSAWHRVAAVRAFATPLPFAQVVALPLALLPPNRVRLLNAAQCLQTLVTQLFATPGWGARCRKLALSLPAHSVRQDFNLFVGAMAPRMLEAGANGMPAREALEDAWLHERVQRRWQYLALCLGEAGCEALLEPAGRLVNETQATTQVLHLAAEQATEEWGLPIGAAAGWPTAAFPALPLAHKRGLTVPRRPISARAPRAARPGTAQSPAAPARHA